MASAAIGLPSAKKPVNESKGAYLYPPGGWGGSPDLSGRGEKLADKTGFGGGNFWRRQAPFLADLTVLQRFAAL